MAAHTGTVLRFVMVVAGLAAGLRVADAIPRAVTGLPRGAVRVATLDQLGSPDGTPVSVPAYFPDSLEWPPDELRRYPGGSTLVEVRHRVTRQPWLLIACVTPADRRRRVEPLPGTTVLQDTETSLHGTTVRLQRVEDHAGAVWHQISWPRAACDRTIRYRGSLAELYRLAVSLTRGERR